MPSPYPYKSGDIYGYLMLTGKAYSKINGKSYSKQLECICVCSKIFFAYFSQLRSGRTKSCGCKRTEFIQKTTLKHGLAKDGAIHPVYRAWRAIRNRVKGSRKIDRICYSDKGILVCHEWDKSFDSFYNWSISNGWQQGLSIDRINNDGHYEPSNCRWVTMVVQSRNTRRSINLTAFGETKNMADWLTDERCIPKRTTVKNRLDNGWSAEDALTIKLQRNHG